MDLATVSKPIITTVEDAQSALSCSWKMTVGPRKINTLTVRMMERFAGRNQEIFQMAGL